MRSWLRFPRALWLALGLASVLVLPSLFIGLILDDYMHLVTLEGSPTLASPMNLFTFAAGKAVNEPFIRHGPFPWWTLPDVKLTFFRPLSSALINFDWHVFGRTYWLYHLHSLLWYLLLVWSASLLYRRALPAATAAGALLLFAIDDVHWLPVSWLANRNALVAAVPMVLALVAHRRWREDGFKAGLPLSLVGYLISLLAGEAALGGFMYLAAYEFLGRPERWGARVRALVPAGMVGLGYVLIYKGLHFGAYGSAVYVDPSTSPLQFLWVAPARITALLGAQILGLSADLWMAAGVMPTVLVAGGSVSVLLLGWLWRELRECIPPDEARELTWLVAGAVGALLPVAATFPANRLLLMPSLGFSAVVAVLLREGWRSSSRMVRGSIRVLAFVWVPFALLSWPLQTAIFGLLSRWSVDVARTTEVSDTSGQQVLVLNAPDFAVGLYPPIIRAHEGHPLPRAWNVLSMAPYDHKLTRTGAGSFELEVLNGRMLTTVFEQLVRAESFPLLPQSRVALDGATVTVLAESEGHPTRIAVDMEKPLEDASVVLLEWKARQLRRFQPPAIGESVVLKTSGGIMKPF